MSDLRVYRVDGMSYDGCIRAITDAIRKFDPTAFVQVDLWGGTVSVAGAPDENQNPAGDRTRRLRVSGRRLKRISS